jgi:hypothetical protein
MIEMHLENKLVAHREIDVLHQAILEMNRPERDVVDFCACEMTIFECAVDKRYADEIAQRKVAFIENAAFKLLEVQVIAIVRDSGIMLLKKVGCHRAQKYAISC